MKYVSKDEQLKKLLIENREIKADIKVQEAKTDYIAMMLGMNIEIGGNQDDEK